MASEVPPDGSVEVVKDQLSEAPELIPDLAPGLGSLADLLIADRDNERNR